MMQHDPINAGTRALMERLTPWRRRRALFLRAVSMFLLLEGVFHWAVICGIVRVGGELFENMDTPAQAAVIWGAIIDPIAGVGLWLGAGWGVVMWLFATVTRIGLDFWAPEGMTRFLLLSLFEMSLIVAYAVMSVRAARESDED